MTKLLSLIAIASFTFALNAGTETKLYIGGWPNQLVVVDENTYQVVKRIQMKTDVPRNLLLSQDRSKLIVGTLKDSIETVDLAKGDVVDSFTLGERNRSINLGGLAIDPEGKLL